MKRKGSLQNPGESQKISFLLKELTGGCYHRRAKAEEFIFDLPLQFVTALIATFRRRSYLGYSTTPFTTLQPWFGCGRQNILLLSACDLVTGSPPCRPCLLCSASFATTLVA
jgi:hypothetical protein